MLPAWTGPRSSRWPGPGGGAARRRCRASSRTRCNQTSCIKEGSAYCVILLSEFVQRALGVAHDGLVVEVVLHHHKHEPHQDHEARGLHDLCESVLSVNIMNP